MISIRASSMMLIAGLVFSAGGAAAQTLNEETDFGLPQFYGRGKNVSVMERERPEYQATGIHAGGFTLLPTLELGMDYSDNLFAYGPHDQNVSPFNNAKSAIGFIVNPSIVAQSNWGRHSLTALASVKNETFANFASEDQTAYTFQTEGRIDVHGDSYINIGADGEHDYEMRGSTTTQTQSLKPVPYDTQGVYARGLYAADRVQAALDADYRNYHYEAVEVIEPPVAGQPTTYASASEYLRDFTQGRIGGRVDFALTPDEALFSKVSYSEGDYFNGNASNPKRNYDEVRILGGGDFDITALARGEIGLGYVNRQYQLSAFRGLSGLAASAKVEYFPTQLVTLTLTGQRLVEDAVFSTASGYFENVVTLGADYELKRNILISALGGFEYDQFKGVDRKDTVSNLQLSGKYLLSRYVGLGATLSYTNRDSAGAPTTLGPVYDETRLMFKLILQR